MSSDQMKPLFVRLSNYSLPGATQDLAKDGPQHKLMAPVVLLAIHRTLSRMLKYSLGVLHLDRLIRSVLIS